jgi:hypothetical protein
LVRLTAMGELEEPSAVLGKVTEVAERVRAGEVGGGVVEPVLPPPQETAIKVENKTHA